MYEIVPPNQNKNLASVKTFFTTSPLFITFKSIGKINALTINDQPIKLSADKLTLAPYPSTIEYPPINNPVNKA